jgi:RecA-family ATPase
MCLSVVSGEEFLRRWPVTKRGPAVYINGEDGEQLTQPRLRKLAATLGVSYPQPDLILSCQQQCDVSTPRGWGRIARLVRRVQPVLVVIDCFRRFAPRVNENNSSEVSPILSRARNLQKETGAAICFVHHLSRDNEWSKKVPPTQRLRGSGEFYAWFDSAIGMEHPEKKKPEHYMTAEHRGAGQPDEQTVCIAWDDEREECHIRLGEPRTKKDKQRRLSEQEDAYG